MDDALRDIKTQLSAIAGEMSLISAREESDSQIKLLEGARSPPKKETGQEPTLHSEIHTHLKRIDTILNNINTELKEIKGSGIARRTKTILEEIEDVKDVIAANTSKGQATGLAEEIAISDTASQIREIIAPLREDVTKVADIQKTLIEAKKTILEGDTRSTLGTSDEATRGSSHLQQVVSPLRREVREAVEGSREVARTLVWINSALKKGGRVEPNHTYAAALKFPKPENHTIIISSKDPTKTGDGVIDEIRTTLDVTNTGITVEKIRKGKDRKVILTAGSAAAAKTIKEKLNVNNNLAATEPVNKNPLIRLNNVMSYLTDREITDNLYAQNKTLFTTN
ncbi:hypothetical protein ACJJTC_007673 [Scirpophaga incertulas]